jgi:hypothetical protein
MSHAQGIAKLMEQRGPAAHKEGLDASLFLSFRGIIVGSVSYVSRGCIGEFRGNTGWGS